MSSDLGPGGECVPLPESKISHTTEDGWGLEIGRKNNNRFVSHVSFGPNVAVRYSKVRFWEMYDSA